MALYLVVHTPRPEEEETVHPPSRLVDLARVHGQKGVLPRWLKTWSPDLHDERIFSLWEAQAADDISAAMARFGFLSEMDAHPVHVAEWGPEDVLARAEELGESHQ